MTKRTMTVTRSPGHDDHKPMIRISNNLLKKYGFTVGDKFTVEYAQNIIIIKKI